MTASLRDQALGIWRAGVDAVRPGPLMRQALAEPVLKAALESAERILVFGAGKAGAAMSSALEDTRPDLLPRMEGVVNVPAETVVPLKKIRLHPARPAGSNHPTSAGVEGTRQILELARSASPKDVGLCLLSGGGSALLPAPAAGLTLDDKQQVTKLLHSCGATINEMNAVRKHLSAIKGGRLAEAFTRCALFSLIISDVIGDPLDVIASGPTAVDPTTYGDALNVLRRFQIIEQVPRAVRKHLERGAAGDIAETLKTPSPKVSNLIIGNNQRALAACQREAERLGYRVLNLGSYLEGETKEVAVALAGIVRSIRAEAVPLAAPVCLLSGGETTVTMGAEQGKGGRNQEFVLAALVKLGREGLRDVVILSGGSDGEDGPTDAAGAVGSDDTVLDELSARYHLARHDAYTYFDAVGGLLRTGLTQTNVMDIRVVLMK